MAPLKRHKQIWAALLTLGLILLSAHDKLLQLYLLYADKGINVGFVVGAYIIFQKWMRNRRLDKRDADYYHNDRVIMESLGVGDKWRGPRNASVWRVTTRCSAGKNETGSISSWVGSITARSASKFMIYHTRRVLSMGKLNSRKLWAFIVLVLLNGLNDTLGLGLSADTIKTISELGVGYIFAQAGVDALSPLVVALLARFTTKPSGGVIVEPTKPESSIQSAK